MSWIRILNIDDPFAVLVLVLKSQVLDNNTACGSARFHAGTVATSISCSYWDMACSHGIMSTQQYRHSIDCRLANILRTSYACWCTVLPSNTRLCIQLNAMVPLSSLPEEFICGQRLADSMMYHKFHRQSIRCCGFANLESTSHISSSNKLYCNI